MTALVPSLVRSPGTASGRRDLSRLQDAGRLGRYRASVAELGTPTSCLKRTATAATCGGARSLTTTEGPCDGRSTVRLQRPRLVDPGIGQSPPPRRTRGRAAHLVPPRPPSIRPRFSRMWPRPSNNTSWLARRSVSPSGCGRFRLCRSTQGLAAELGKLLAALT